MGATARRGRVAVSSLCNVSEGAALFVSDVKELSVDRKKMTLFARATSNLTGRASCSSSKLPGAWDGGQEHASGFSGNWPNVQRVSVWARGCRPETSRLAPGLRRLAQSQVEAEFQVC